MDNFLMIHLAINYANRITGWCLSKQNCLKLCVSKPIASRQVISIYIITCRSWRGNASVQFELELNPHAQKKCANVIEIFSGDVVQLVNTVTGV